jgi:hypothetical protein
VKNEELKSIMSNGLTDSMVSAVQIASPLWTEAVVKNYLLDARYVTVFNLIINGLIKTVTPMLNDTYATYFLCCISTFIILYYINNRYDQVFMRYINKIISFQKTSGIIQYLDDIYLPISRIDTFLYNHQEYFKGGQPIWIFPYFLYRDIYSNDLSGIKTEIADKCCYLADGKYLIKVSNTLEFMLYINTHTEKQRRDLHYTFIKGNEHDLLRECINLPQQEIYSKRLTSDHHFQPILYNTSSMTTVVLP